MTAQREVFESKPPPQAVNSPAIYGGVKVNEICFSPFQRAYYQPALAVCFDHGLWLKPIAEKDVKTPFWGYNNSYPAVNGGAMTAKRGGELSNLMKAPATATSPCKSRRRRSVALPFMAG